MKTWKHPGIGETRIYLNGEFRNRNCKLWICRFDRGPVDFVIKQRGFRGLDEACEEAAFILRRNGIDLCNTTWSKLIAAAA